MGSVFTETVQQRLSHCTLEQPEVLDASHESFVIDQKVEKRDVCTLVFWVLPRELIEHFLGFLVVCSLS